MSELSQSIDNFRPLYFYEIYEVDNLYRASQVDWIPAWIAEKRYDTVYKFEGRQATYWIGTHDRSVLRGDALKMAISIHSGKVKISTCALSQVSR
jgi:hypothetical protein